MKICSHCGQPNEDQIKFCQFCGQQFAGNNADNQQSSPAPKKSKLWLWLLLPAIGVIGIIGLASVIFLLVYLKIDDRGAIPNVNTNPQPKVSPTPQSNPLYTQPSSAFLKDSPVGGLAPGDTWKKADVEKSVKFFFPEFTGTPEDAAAREYFRDEPDEQITLMVLKYDSQKFAETNCQTIEKIVENLRGSSIESEHYQYKRTQMPVAGDKPKETASPNAVNKRCQTIIGSKTETGGSMVAALWTRRNLLFIVSADKKSAGVVPNFISDYKQWFETANNTNGNASSIPSSGGSAGANITAIELFRAYKTNPASADGQYKGKTVTITGAIAAGGTDLTGKVFALFEVGESLNSVRCTFPDSEKAAVTALKPNQTATFSGKIDGAMVGDVLISDCAFAE